MKPAIRTVVDGVKRCTVCGATGPFYRDKSRSSGLTDRCQTCCNERVAARRAAHPEKVREERRREYAKHVDRYRANFEAWRAANPDRWRATCRRAARAYYWRDPERHRLSARSFNEAHRDRRRAAESRYAQSRPDYARDKTQRRRAALAGVERTLTRAEWLAILEYFGHRCAYCLRGDVELGQEHVVAVSRGGGHVATNVVPACQSCNSKKGNRPVFLMAAHI